MTKRIVKGYISIVPAQPLLLKNFNNEEERVVQIRLTNWLGVVMNPENTVMVNVMVHSKPVNGSANCEKNNGNWETNGVPGIHKYGVPPYEVVNDKRIDKSNPDCTVFPSWIPVDFLKGGKEGDVLVFENTQYRLNLTICQKGSFYPDEMQNVIDSLLDTKLSKKKGEILSLIY